jgi:hypothetical protein
MQKENSNKRDTLLVQRLQPLIDWNPAAGCSAVIAAAASVLVEHLPAPLKLGPPIYNLWSPQMSPGVWSLLFLPLNRVCALFEGQSSTLWAICRTSQFD